MRLVSLIAYLAVVAAGSILNTHTTTNMESIKLSGGQLACGADDDLETFKCNAAPPNLKVQSNGTVVVTLRAILDGTPVSGSASSVILSKEAPRIGFMAVSESHSKDSICSILSRSPESAGMHNSRYGSWISAQNRLNLGPRALYVVVSGNDYKQCAHRIWTMLQSVDNACWSVAGLNPKLMSQFRVSTHAFAMQKLHWPNYLRHAPEVRRILTLDLDTAFAFNSSLAMMWHRVSEIFEEHKRYRGRTALMAASVEPALQTCQHGDKSVRFGFNSGVVAWDMVALAKEMAGKRWYSPMVDRGFLNMGRLGDQNVFNYFARLFPDRFAVLDCNMNMAQDKLIGLEAALDLQLCLSHHKERCCVPTNYLCRSLPLVYHFNAGANMEKILHVMRTIATIVHSKMVQLGFGQANSTSCGVASLISATASIMLSENSQLMWKRDGCNPGIKSAYKGAECCKLNVTNNSVCDVNTPRIHYVPPLPVVSTHN